MRLTIILNKILEACLLQKQIHAYQLDQPIFNPFLPLIRR
jgi:hypothetical protein